MSVGGGRRGARAGEQRSALARFCSSIDRINTWVARFWGASIVLVTAAILYNFGTGPVKGFAVSLFVGLTASLFTAVFFTRLLVFLAFAVASFIGLWSLGHAVQLPSWMVDYRAWLAIVLGAIGVLVFYRLRSARPPKTSFYQPVRIRQAKVHFAGVMSGPGAVVFMKLAFTNPDYLNAFVNANAEAIKAKQLAVVRA